jgi:mannose-6-phosphate isomerase-like protein (cupin superfamily)
MAHRAQTLENPASGERITFRQTSASTGGELLAIDLELPANRRVPGGQHIHPNQEERFEVVEGTMRFRMGRKRVVARPGEVVVVPLARSTTSRMSATMTRWSASRCARR